MPIHQIPTRAIKVDGTLPPFPADMEITAELIPEELFGLRACSGYAGLGNRQLLELFQASTS